MEGHEIASPLLPTMTSVKTVQVVQVVTDRPLEHEQVHVIGFILSMCCLVIAGRLISTPFFSSRPGLQKLSGGGPGRATTSSARMGPVDAVPWLTGGDGHPYHNWSGHWRSLSPDCSKWQSKFTCKQCRPSISGGPFEHHSTAWKLT